jgi:hypothetical protein
MKRNLFVISVISVLVFFGLFAFAVSANALDERGDDPSMSIPSQGDSKKITPEWGTSAGIIQTVSSGSFTPIKSTYTYDQNFGWRWSTTGSSSWFDASLNLPAGAKVLGFWVEYYDNDPANNVVAWFQVAPWASSTSNYYPALGLSSSGTPGYDYMYADLTANNIIIDNYSNTYSIRVKVGGNSNTAFRSVQVLYKLQVSPAPATATFSDVPTSHPFFKFVEALVASGITAGCGGGKYCPDAPLTRGEMAVFLSTALGLHWPY